MSDALREQLLKAGLTTEQDVKQARSEKKRKGKPKRKAQPAPAQTEAERREAEKRARDRALNREREAERQRKADEHAARELVVKHEIPHGQDGEIGFNFTYGSRIKQIYVNAEQQKQLAAGTLAIARTRGRFRLIPREVAEKVKPKAPFIIAFLDEGGDDDPAYEEHPIPDDLVW
ncbi:DUF2058 domain-containing protein [Ectothiorhodospiraceae bacterium WFHF3C12]|nr:DUF2058 domain-containing protein [Ectothiorhodospiraceae bacterium WFHF3C12]